MPVYFDHGILKIRPGTIAAFPRVHYLQRLPRFGPQLAALGQQILPGCSYQFFGYIIFQIVIQSFSCGYDTLTCTARDKKGLHQRQAIKANSLLVWRILL
jgi:hypothetical protein